MLQVRAGSELPSSSDKGTSMRLRVRDDACKAVSAEPGTKGILGYTKVCVLQHVILFSSEKPSKV